MQIKVMTINLLTFGCLFLIFLFANQFQPELRVVSICLITQ